MPVHRVSSAPGHLEKAVDNLERNERIIGFVIDGDGMTILVTEPKPRTGKETRG